ncbi:hypothetical protein Tco_0285585 [Tanacetum coccineum]
MENEHELSYETLTRVYLGSYEHYKSVVAEGAELESLEPGFELQGAKMVEMGKGSLEAKVSLKSNLGHMEHLEVAGLLQFLVRLTYLVSSLTLDVQRDICDEWVPCTTRPIPVIPISSSISPEGFLLLVLLLVVIIVMVVIVIVILILRLFEARTFPSILLGVPVGPVFLLGLLALAIDAACAFRAEEMPSLISCWMAAKVMAGVSDVDVLLGGILSTKDNAQGYGMTHEDGDNDVIGGNDDERAIRTKKYRGSNSNDGGNTGDGVKIAGGKDENTGGIILSLEFSEELKELLSDEAEK